MKSKKKHVKDTSNEELERMKSQLVRTLADYDNLVKRVDREKLELRGKITRQVISRLLPVFDMLYDAQTHLNDGGLALTIKELEETLKSEGIVKIEAKKGDEFSEELHEAVETGESEEVGNGQIISVVLTGWKFKEGPVIRHTKVIVNKTKPQPGT